MRVLATPRPRARRAAPSRGVRALAVLLALAALMGVPGTAWASWTTAGLGTGTASTGTLVAVSALSVTSAAGSSSVGVLWAAPSSGVAPAGYRVDRTDTASGVTVAACGSSASSLLASTSCTDVSVADGTYRYTVTAVRAGWTAVGAPSATVSVLATVTTTVSLASSVNPSVVGQSVAYTATVAAATGTPSGSVVFRDGGVPIACAGGTQTLSAGTATCVVAWASAGSRAITATYAGSSPYGASSSVAVAQVVALRPQAISFTSTPPGSATAGGAYTAVATATSGLAVTFSSTTTGVCTVTGSTVTFVAAGTCTIGADQGGNTTWAAALRVTQSFTVARAAQTITFTSTAPASAMPGDPAYAVAATATSGLVVTFTSTTPAVCTVSGSSVTYVAPGTCTVSGDQAGNAAWAPAAQAAQSFLVTAVPAAPTGLAIDASGSTPTATWTAVPGNSYECQVTNGTSPAGATSWVPCTSPYAITTPKSGNQTFYLRTLRGGAVSAQAFLSFRW